MSGTLRCPPRVTAPELWFRAFPTQVVTHLWPSCRRGCSLEPVPMPTSAQLLGSPAPHAHPPSPSLALTSLQTASLQLESLGGGQRPASQRPFPTPDSCLVRLDSLLQASLRPPKHHGAGRCCWACHRSCGPGSLPVNPPPAQLH